MVTQSSLSSRRWYNVSGTCSYRNRSKCFRPAARIFSAGRATYGYKVGNRHFFDTVMVHVPGMAGKIAAKARGKSLGRPRTPEPLVAQIESLAKTIQKLVESTGTIRDNATELSASGDDLTAKSQDQARSFEATAQELSTLSTSVANTADQAQDTSQLVSNMQKTMNIPDAMDEE